MTPEVRWFDWDSRLAVVAGMTAFVLSPRHGWLPVNRVDVTWDGQPVSAEEGAEIFAAEFEKFGPPPLGDGAVP